MFRVEKEVSTCGTSAAGTCLPVDTVSKAARYNDAFGSADTGILSIMRMDPYASVFSLSNHQIIAAWLSSNLTPQL